MDLPFCKFQRFVRLAQPDIAERDGRPSALVRRPIGLIGQHETDEVPLAAADIEDGHAWFKGKEPAIPFIRQGRIVRQVFKME